ncbi:esterase [Methylobacterium mesophilicum SR1.6/6]|uniref:Esterase n=1 Tax=Methylobacterium mesophilicum SR1.6/6 TaxID=908290 RepID=A0A6B9FTJ7_9HYPH|nr:esterase [Methylobacterium mesophilicum]QGY05901.1 esterase [Methylobacterium mesophilicum SR1.6/6]
MAGSSVPAPSRARRAACAAVVAMLIGGGPARAADPPPGPLTIAEQGSFFVGGRDVASDTLSTLPAYAPSGTISVDQIYVRYQVPVSAARPPLVLIHGCCLTGKTWETTPDGRMGWDEFFVRRGFPTYVIDQAWRGRSAASPAQINAVKSGHAELNSLPTVFSAGREPAWAIFRFGPEYPKVFPGMQFPLEAQGEFWKQMVPDWSASLAVPNPTVPALSELAKRLKGAVLVSHSQSGIYPFQTAALDRTGIRALVAIEPAACPDPAKDDLAPYKDLPILVLFGDYVDASPRWAPRLKLCRSFVAAANAAGGKAELILLPEIGIHGNSHMLMQDKNSLDIADWLSGWIEKRVSGKS